MPRTATTDTALAIKLWVVLSRAHAAVSRHAEAHAARHGLTTAEFGVLAALHEHGRLLLGEVQRKILVSSGGITYLVDRLQAKGFVERQACPEDRRASYAVLTAKGSALIERVLPEHERCIAHALSGLSSSDKRTARSLLRTLGLTAAQLDPCEGTSP